MMVLGSLLVAIGTLLAASQVFTVTPYQPLLLLGVLLAVAGGILIADREPRGRRGHGHR